MYNTERNRIMSYMILHRYKEKFRNEFKLVEEKVIEYD